MDRISALRNVEDALADFGDGDASLDDVEDRVLGVLRTYATEFDGPEWTGACAAARLAAPGAPLVVGDDLFSNATRTSAVLDAPVVLVEV